MKSFYKNALIISVICIILGLGMTIVGAAKGGIELFKRMVDTGELSFSYGDNTIGISDDSIGIISGDDEESYEDDEIYEYDFATAEYNIENLDLSAEATTVWMEYRDVDTFHVTIEKSEIGGSHSCEVKDNTLYIESSAEEVMDVIGDSTPHEITLTIPKGYMFKEAKLSLGAGSIEGERIEAEQILADIGAGNMEIETMKAGKNIEVSVGAGNFEVDEMKAEELKIKCDAGRTYAEEVAVNKNVTLTCDAGYVYIEMKERQKSYNYDLECAMGSISIGNKTQGGVVFSDKINNQADRTVKAECNIGAIEIEFDD